MSEKSEHARLEAFCDGVFAIAITLLILEIKIPPIGSSHTIREFWHRLLGDWPSWFGFFLSFMIILVAWVNHHDVFKLIGKSSAQFTYANGFMLLTVVVVPFSTGLMSEYLTTDLAQPAITVYCFSILMHNLSWVLFGRAAMYPGSLFKDRASHDLYVKNVYRSSQVAFLFYALLCMLSFWFPFVSMVIMTLSWVYWVFISVAVNAGQKHSD
jgi:uncharacterized membrane protein